MKKISYMIIVVIAIVTTYNIGISKKKVQVSDLILSNIDALANRDEVGSGDPCYSDAKYNIDKPESVKCGTPCVYEHLEIPWFPSTSNCPYY